MGLLSAGSPASAPKRPCRELAPAPTTKPRDARKPAAPAQAMVGLVLSRPLATKPKTISLVSSLLRPFPKARCPKRAAQGAVRRLSDGLFWTCWASASSCRSSRFTRCSLGPAGLGWACSWPPSQPLSFRRGGPRPALGSLWATAGDADQPVRIIPGLHHGRALDDALSADPQPRARRTFGGSIATAQAYVADVTEPKDRARYMGLIGASIGMGFVLGPFVGAEMSRFGFAAASYLAAGLHLRPNPGRAVLREPPRGARPLVRLSLPQALAQPVIGRLLLTNFVTALAFVGMEATFALLGKQRFLGPATMGRFFAGIGIVLAAVQGGLVGRLVSRFGEHRVAIAGALILAVSLFLIPWAPHLGYLAGTTCSWPPARACSSQAPRR